MPGTVNIPLTTLTAGTHTFGPAAVADADHTVTLNIDRTVTGGLNSLTSATTVHIKAQESDDGGTTWYDLADAGLEGGSYLDHNGVPYATSFVQVTFATATGRQARASIVVAGTSVAVAGSIVVA